MVKLKNKYLNTKICKFLMCLKKKTKQFYSAAVSGATFSFSVYHILN
jgi:hypothetical protein